MTFLKAMGLSLQICGFMTLITVCAVAIVAFTHFLLGTAGLLLVSLILAVFGVAGVIYNNENK